MDPAITPDIKVPSVTARVAGVGSRVEAVSATAAKISTVR